MRMWKKKKGLYVCNVMYDMYSAGRTVTVNGTIRVMSKLRYW